MPIYEFKCLDCSLLSENEVLFDIHMTINNYTNQVNCPACSSSNTKRVYSVFAIHEGLTASEKTAGTTKKRKDMGKATKDQRDKRKKQSDPSSYEGQSNEYWVNQNKS